MTLPGKFLPVLAVKPKTVPICPTNPLHGSYKAGDCTPITASFTLSYKISSWIYELQTANSLVISYRDPTEIEYMK